MNNEKKKLKLNSKTVRRMTELAVETNLRAGLLRASDGETETCGTCGSCTSECDLPRLKV
jgi:heterodisulfide reductase subunit C